MNLIRKIKNCQRHKQNKKLSIFAEAMFNVSWRASNVNILIHPLIFEIIRFNHFGEICGNLKGSEFVDNPFSYLLDTESLYRIPRSLSLEEQQQLEKIPLSVFAQPELYIGKLLGYGIDKTIFTTSPVPPKPPVFIKEK